MKVVSCYVGRVERIGFDLVGHIALVERGSAASSVKELLSGGEDRLSDAFDDAVRREEFVDYESVEYRAPIPDPDKIICLAANYWDFLEETGAVPSPVPVFFAKFPNSLAGCGATIAMPEVSRELGCEAEVAVVIGRTARGVDAQDAWSFVAGLMPFNDLCLTDVQFRTSQWTVGKSLDGFAPCGPALVTLEEVDDLNAIPVILRINGEVVQESSLGQLVHSIPETIAYLSNHMTLTPGDVIATGTPAHVPHLKNPPRYLDPGDIVEVDTGPVGTLSNRIV